MADRGSSGLSKAAKKNLKRKAAKQRAAASGGATIKPKNEDLVTPEELKEMLTKQMETAKQQKDKKAIDSLREQLWVVGDLIAGVKTDLPDEDLKRILEKLPINEALKQKAKPEPETNENKAPESAEPKDNGVENGVEKPATEIMDIPAAEKKLRAMKKKLKEVRKLKEKLANGEKLEKNQMEKAKLEASLIDEVDELELDIKEAKLNS